MKNILIIAISIFSLFSCKTSKNTVECKNEVKTQKATFKKPYNYNKVSTRKVERINNKLEVQKEKAKNNVEETAIYVSTENSIDISKNPIQERVKKYQQKKEEYRQLRKKRNLGSGGQFFLALALTILLIFAGFTLFAFLVLSGGDIDELTLIFLSLFFLYLIIKVWIKIYS